MAEPLRTGIVGGGLVAQLVHLPTLSRMNDLFHPVALADPSERVRSGLAAQYLGLKTHSDWRDMLEAEALDALVVCHPQAGHTEVVLAALDLGIHCFVEKPLCIAVGDADLICERRERTGLVVQVGYMKRFDAGFEALIELFADRQEAPRLIDVVTRDPGMNRPPFQPPDFVHGGDVPESILVAAAEQEREQVEAAIGLGDPGTVKAFNYTYLACLIHDVNLVHGALGQLGVEVPLQPLVAADWAVGKGASIGFRLPGGGIWNCSWLLLEGTEDFVEEVGFYFADEIDHLQFAAPYMRERFTELRSIRADGGVEITSRGLYPGDPYHLQLEHFHSCVVDGTTCRTPPEQAQLDLVALRDAFLLGRKGGSE